MDNITMQLLTAFLGSFGFALVFRVSRERLLPASLGGLLSWAVFLLVEPLAEQAVPCYFIASVVVTIYAEILARLLRCPATVFLVTGAVPLIPGGSLYRTMSCIMARDYDAFSSQGFLTVLYAMAIAVGMLFPTSVFQLLRRIRVLMEKNKSKEHRRAHHE